MRGFSYRAPSEPSDQKHHFWCELEAYVSDFVPEFMAWSGGAFQMVAGVAAVLYVALEMRRKRRKSRARPAHLTATADDPPLRDNTKALARSRVRAWRRASGARRGRRRGRWWRGCRWRCGRCSAR